MIAVLVLFFATVTSIHAYDLSSYVFDFDETYLANAPVEIEDEAEAAEHLFSVSENTLSASSSTKLYLRENDLLSKEAPTFSGYYSQDFRYGASAEWSYTLDGDIDGSYYKVDILLYAYQTTCDLKIIHKKQSGGETVLASWTGVSTSDPGYYQWKSYDTNSGVNPDASPGDKIIFRVTSANNDKWVSVRFGGVSVGSYIKIPLEVLPSAPCGCGTGTYNYSCGQIITESCTLNCNLIATGNCFKIGADNIVIDGAGFNLTGDKKGAGISADGKNNLVIKNINIYNFSYGIYLVNSSNDDIINNNLSSNNYGIFLGSCLGCFSNFNTLTSNIANNNSVYGIYLYYSSNNTLTNNKANDNFYEGIHLSSSSNNILTSNTASNNGRVISDGIYLWESNYNTLTSNTVNNNGDNGIFLTRSSDNKIINNSANNNQENGLIILSDSTDNIINSNTFCSNNQSGGFYYDMYIGAGSAKSGDENTCNTTLNWNDVGTTGCTYSCVGMVYNIRLTRGWNLVSSPLNFTNLTEVFEPIKDDFVSMFSYDAEYQKFIEIDPFSVEEISLPHGAWINVLENVNLTIAGKEIENMDIPLFQGWNLVGYPYIIETDINNSDFKNYTTFAYMNNSWSSYIPNRSINSLETLKPGYGYWVKVE